MEIHEKVKGLLSMDITAYEIEKQTGISRPTIMNMRKVGYNFLNMSYGTAVNLAKYYDTLNEGGLIFIDQGGFISFSLAFDNYVKSIKSDNSNVKTKELRALQSVIGKLGDIALKDIDLLQQLYEVYKQSLAKEKEERVDPIDK
ncbi:hypothetical protein I6N95_26545 [Vagococcus sp. BWB3-3]|uniref:Uncharacterized protein n=1 Tax=Vagococcus allomyrinae TaxID=2794353 RepID=A0A940PGR5_9ENTE|nr:hypothetical protein [Vagococcus allomyrinae]MBP1044575.1 hypothetical protein [Vagococcus allomyrinae]